ncbi:MAG: transporter, partial [Paludibacteraceae bacterium]|nr:transporter [Paludibacteraceae bacterium]
MNWIIELFAENAIAGTIFLFSVVIALGMALGKIKIGGISFGVVFVLFVALAVGHLHLPTDALVMDVLKNLGLIFFIYSVGLQVGPSFFSSFKHGGLKLNALAVLIALLGTGTTIALFYIINSFTSSTSFPMLVGVLSGAVTSTPSLGAAQEALDQLGNSDPISLGYAVAYPVGVLGTMLVMVLL